jgi:anaerobic ribonucleoside-triphosphate reductase activating protein
MNYGTIKPLSIENGPGVRVSLFVSGCRRHCKGCFNQEAQSFSYGKEFTSETLQELLEMLENPRIKGLSILGGDPFEWENGDVVLDICKAVRSRFGDTKTIWMWTGYDFIDDELIDLDVMQYIDVLVDGPFIEEQKNLNLFYRGSANQRVIDVQRSLKYRCAIRYKGTQEWK